MKETITEVCGMAIFLEDSDGSHQNNPSEAQITATLERIGSSLDHCILHLPGESFVQTAGDSSGLLIEYGDATGLYASDGSDFDVATVARVFAEAAAGRDGWKNEFSFRKTDEAPGGADAGGRSFRMPGVGSGTGTTGGAGAGTGGSLKDQLLGQVKREISREASRGVGNIVRKGIRGIMGRR
jgi:hypothetical protein